MDKAGLLDWTGLQEVPMCTSDSRFRHSFADIEKKMESSLLQCINKTSISILFWGSWTFQNTHILCAGPTVSVKIYLIYYFNTCNPQSHTIQQNQRLRSLTLIDFKTLESFES